MICKGGMRRVPLQPDPSARVRRFKRRAVSPEHPTNLQVQRIYLDLSTYSYQLQKEPGAPDARRATRQDSGRKTP